MKNCPSIGRLRTTVLGATELTLVCGHGVLGLWDSKKTSWGRMKGSEVGELEGGDLQLTPGEADMEAPGLENRIAGAKQVLAHGNRLC